VRNPLGAIRGTAEILSSRVAGDAVSEEFATLLLKETDRLNDVLENFLRFVRGSRTTGESCDLVPIVSELLALLDREFRKARVSVRNLIAEPSLRVALPASSARQILINLLLNATQILAEHDGDRVVELSVQLECAEKRRDARVHLFVADSGPGVSGGRKEEIFDPFFTTRRGGTGLGLPIAARLASDAHGSLMVIPRDASRLGGATFELIARAGGHDDMPTPPPLAEPPEADSPPTARQAVSPARRSD
jgi:signal transduction histidine kinase